MTVTNPRTEPLPGPTLPRDMKGPRWARWLYRVSMFIETLGLSEFPMRKKQP